MLRRMLKARLTGGKARASMVRALAGLPAAARRTRRGSFLIMVVGTLALLAIITVVYVSIGRSDRQTSTAARKAAERQEVPEQFRDYVAGIIADDLFDTVYLGERGVDPATGNVVPFFRREAWDYPSAAFQATVPDGGGELNHPITVGEPGDARFHFTPTGDGTGTDPWLASLEPGLLNFDGTALNDETEPDRYFRERLDWFSISNLSPDGAFVNLYNLRGLKGLGGRSQGNFDATPWEMRGLGTGNGSLTLFAADPVNDGARNGDPDYGDTLVGSEGNDAQPAQFGSRQRWMAFPTAEPRAPGNIPPGDSRYLLYQYADADGDGILDARWIEMVEDRDPNDEIERWLIDQEPGVRYFFAARAVDLSGRVNVNTATDATLGPSEDDPLGLTPASIDLRRILTLDDLYTDQRTAFGYESFIQPNYPDPADPLDPADYSLYDASGGSGNMLAYDAGEKAYDAIRTILDTGVMPEPGYWGLQLLASGGPVDREFAIAPTGTPNPYWAAYWKTNGQFRPTEYYNSFAGFGAEGGYSQGGAISSGLGRPFGHDSLLDLLAFNTANDDRTRSPLEIALGGRGDPASDPVLMARFSPLRENRPTNAVERVRGGWVGMKYGFYLPAKAAVYADIRQRLTTISGSRPIVATTIAASQTDTDRPDPDGLALGAADMRAPAQDLFGGVPATAASAAQELFHLYARVLAPYSTNQTHWDPGDADFFRNRTLYYGDRGPDLALRTAGFLAVNMRDAYDQNNAPTKATLLLNGSDGFRSANNLGVQYAGPRPVEYPWRVLDLDPDAPSTVYPPLWDGSSITGMPDAVNVFGIEALPFITEAASFTVYTDTPSNAPLSGDRDFPIDRDGDGIDEINRNYLPTIDGDAAESNPDCLFEVLAFQVHNPFDETIQLSDGVPNTVAPGLYYIQYGDQYYKLSEVDAQGAESGGIVLGPHDSKTVYVLSANPERILDRINNALDPDTTVDTVNGWITKQLDGGADVVRIGEFDRTTGAVIAPSGSYSSLQGGSDAERKVVRLWRVERPELDAESGGFQISGVDESVQNDPANDTLVDRMRQDPTQPVVLDRQLTASPTQSGKISGATPGREPPDPNASRDNEGLSVTRYASLRRRDDPNASAVADVPRGALPAYCLEAKDQGQADSQNETYDDGLPRSGLSIGDFSGLKAARTLRALLDAQSGGTALTKLVPTVTTEPDEKRGDPKNNVAGAKIGNNRHGIPFVGGLVGGLYEPPLYVEANLNNFEFRDDANGNDQPDSTDPFVLRVADLLLPLGIGPHQIPDPAYHNGDEDIEWTTLSEALSMALAYDLPESSDPQSVYAGMFYDPSGLVEPVLDRCSLRYDAFVPFYDDDESGGYNPAASAGDRTWGLGVPAAAALFDAVTTLPPKFASIDAMTRGQLNLNTAPRETLRSLSVLSPPADSSPDGTPNWWWTGDTHDWRSDVATTVTGFRDRVSLFTRSVNDGVAEPDLTINFRDWWDLSDPSNPVRQPPGSQPSLPPGVDREDNARWGATGVAGIHEEPGLRSLGEVAFIRDWGYAFGDPNYPSPHDIDRLGFDEDNLDRRGVDSVTYDFDHDGTRDDDEIDDDYSERLALANAVVSSSSVRSDVFAVWFLVHGYREPDVKGLDDDTPLTPSIARRFVMVVDRSNVVRPGEKPRVLLFKEVPL